VFAGYGYTPDNTDIGLYLSMAEDCYMCQFSTLFRRSALEAAGPFRTELIRSQDYDMFLRILRTGKAVFVPEVMFISRQHSGPRGTAKQRTSAREQNKTWAAYDRIIFNDIFQNLSLSDFKPANVPEDYAYPIERLELLQRACVFARKQMWDKALPDLERAVELGGETAPSQLELDTAARFLMGKHGCQELLEDRRLAESLARLGERRFGRRILSAMARPLAWRARATLGSDRAMSLGYLALMIRFAGPFSIPQVVIRRTVAAVAGRVPAPAGKGDELIQIAEQAISAETG
jgi:hypothetical protein